MRAEHEKTTFFVQRPWHIFALNDLRIRVLFMISVIRSGLDAALNDLGVTSNNIANAKTTGFKKGRRLLPTFMATPMPLKPGARIGMGL